MRGSLTTGQVAERFGYSTDKVAKMCAEGKHFANAELTDGRHWRIPVGDVEAHAEFRRRITAKAREVARRRRAVEAPQGIMDATG